MSEKRKMIQDYILKLMADFDQYGGKNVQRYTKMFDQMTDKQFDAFMHAIRDQKTQLSCVMPNHDTKLTTNAVIDIAKKHNVPLFTRLYLHDSHTGRRYLTKHKILVMKLPVRRLSQYLFHKISLPDSDRHVNPVTGQVIPPDKGAALSAIETQLLASKGLSTSILELVKVRSGDMNAYRTMKYTIEEQGSVSMTDIPLENRPRSTITLQKFFHAMMLDSTI